MFFSFSCRKTAGLQLEKELAQKKKTGLHESVARNRTTSGSKSAGRKPGPGKSGESQTRKRSYSGKKTAADAIADDSVRQKKSTPRSKAAAAENTSRNAEKSSLSNSRSAAGRAGKSRAAVLSPQGDSREASLYRPDDKSPAAARSSSATKATKSAAAAAVTPKNTEVIYLSESGMFLCRFCPGSSFKKRSDANRHTARVTHVKRANEFEAQAAVISTTAPAQQPLSKAAKRSRPHAKTPPVKKNACRPRKVVDQQDNSVPRSSSGKKTGKVAADSTVLSTRDKSASKRSKSRQDSQAEEGVAAEIPKNVGPEEAVAVAAAPKKTVNKRRGQPPKAAAGNLAEEPPAIKQKAVSKTKKNPTATGVDAASGAVAKEPQSKKAKKQKSDNKAKAAALEPEVKSSVAILI